MCFPQLFLTAGLIEWKKNNGFYPGYSVPGTFPSPSLLHLLTTNDKSTLRQRGHYGGRNVNALDFLLTDLKCSIFLSGFYNR